MLVEDGRVTTLSLGDYKIPTARDLPARKTTLVSGATQGPGPFNAKPAAEHAITPIPPAIGNAVFNATGVRLTTLPISCGKVYQGLQPTSMLTRSFRKSIFAAGSSSSAQTWG
jgi:CO/xanthine dehydrogenase Mo-binding subunit